MKAKFDGWCRYGHDRSHAFDAGTEVEKTSAGGKWVPVECIAKFQIILDTQKRVTDAAHAINLHCGVWDCPDGMQKTFSRAEFLRLAVERGVCSPEDEATLRLYWRDVWHRDLSD
jgi:hypothetical protein